MTEVNTPPWVGFPQQNPFQMGTEAHRWASQLIQANYQLQIIVDQLFRRTGAGDDIFDSVDVGPFGWSTASRPSIEMNNPYSAQTSRVETGVIQNNVQINKVDSDIAQIYPSYQTKFPEFNEVEARGFYTAVDWDYIKAFSGSLIVFPKHPNKSAMIRVKNADGSFIQLDGNSRLINGSSNGALRKKNTSIDFAYRLDIDGWEAV